MSKALHFLQITAKHDIKIVHLLLFLTMKNFIPQYPDNALTDLFRLNFTNIEAAIGGKSSREQFGGTVPSAEIYCCK